MLRKFIKILLVCCFSHIATAQVPTNGLVAYYPFNGNFNDYSGNGYNLSQNNSGISFIADRNNSTSSALSLANNSYLYNTTSAIMPSSSYTIAYWVKVPTPTSQYATAVELNENIYGRYLMNSAKTSSTLQMGSYQTATNNYLLDKATSSDHTLWHHHAIIFDDANNLAYLYYDGTLQKSVTVNYSPTPVYLSGLFVGIGTNSNAINTNKALNGQIDDLAIYNRTLTANEINLVKNGCNFSVPISYRPLYKLGEKMILSTTLVADSYQWSKGGSILQNETNDSLIVNNFTLADTGSYTLQITKNGCGVFNSSSVRIGKSQGTDPIACYGFSNANSSLESISGLNASHSTTSQVIDRNNINSEAIRYSGGSSSFSLLPNSTVLKRQELTISMWVKPINAGSYIVFAKNNNISSNFEGLTIVTKNTNQFGAVKIAGNNTTSITGGTYTPNGSVWHHIVLTVKDSLKLYQNGTLVASGIANFNTQYDANTSFVIGGSNQSVFPYPYNGVVDELKFFDNALSNAEVAQLSTTDGNCNSIATDISDSKIIESLSYPNPVKDIVNVSSKGELYNLNGVKISEGENKIDMTDFPKGIYLLKINNTIQKIIKE